MSTMSHGRTGEKGGNQGPHNKAISWKVWEQDKVAPKESGMPGEGGGAWLRAVLT